MPENSRRYAQAVPLIAILMVVIVVVSVAAFFIKTLMVKHQVVVGGDRIKRLETELAELNNKNEALQTKKDQLTSVPALQKVVSKGFVSLVKIDEKFVVNVNQPRPAVAIVEKEGR